MCTFCTGLKNPFEPDIPLADLTRMGLDRGSHAMVLSAHAYAALAGAWNANSCRALKRRCLAILVTLTANFVAEFNFAQASEEPGHLTVTILRKQLLFELFRRARDLMTGLRDTDGEDDVRWALERGENLGKAMIDLASVANHSEWDFHEAERVLIDFANLVTELCERQMARTGKGPQAWTVDSPACRADRLAILLYDAAEEVAIKRQKRFDDA